MIPPFLRACRLELLLIFKMEGIVAQWILAMDVTRMDYRTTGCMGFHSVQARRPAMCVLYRINYASVTKL